MASRKDVTVIIRSAGERTVPVLWNLLKQQVAEEQIFEVNEVPLSKALRKSYQIGIRDNRKWILIIDGDVLPFRNMVDRLLRVFNSLDDRFFTLQCNIVDKMTRHYRRAGIHMHRASCLNVAIDQIPNENKTMRPESDTINNMAGKGYKKLFMKEVLGLHDFEQYHADLFRKGFFSAHKHTQNIPYFKKLWQRLAATDEDYDLLLEGLLHGEEYDGLVVSNINDFDRFNLANILSKKGLTEKNELNPEEIDFDWIGRLYQNFEIPVEYYNTKLLSNSPPPQKISIKRRILQLKGKLGIWKLVPWLICNYLEKGGKNIKNKMED